MSDEEIRFEADAFCKVWAGGDIMAGDLSYYEMKEDLIALLRRVADGG